MKKIIAWTVAVLAIGFLVSFVFGNRNPSPVQIAVRETAMASMSSPAPPATAVPITAPGPSGLPLYVEAILFATLVAIVGGIIFVLWGATKRRS